MLHPKFNVLSIIALLTFLNSSVQARSTQFVQWLDKYTPTPGKYQRHNSLQYQDVNGDGIYDDAIVRYGGSLSQPFSPYPQGLVDSQSWENYRANRPSAEFYGGIVVRFTHVSDIKEKNKDGEEHHVFTRINQPTVQPTEGFRPCSYTTSSPSNAGRLWQPPFGREWGDITLMIINIGGKSNPFSQAFWDAPDNVTVNFTAVYLWKKKDFFNRGNQTEPVVFDNFSRLSVDITRFYKNVEEVRFVVQEGEQLWISEAAAIIQENEDDHQWIAQAGMNVDDRGGATVALNPLKSRWAPYFAFANEAEIEQLQQQIEASNFDPKTATAEQRALHQQNSDAFLNAVNQIEFNARSAAFVEHNFNDVQIVGVYFAAYEFARKITQLTLDNFQAHATGNIPKEDAISLNSGGDFEASNSLFDGGVAVNCAPHQSVARLCLPDKVDIRSEITVDSAHVGQVADLFVYAAYQPSPEETEAATYYMLNDQGHILVWDQDPKTLVAFQKQVTLEAQHSVPLYKGQFILPGFLRIFNGYRLGNGTLVSNYKEGFYVMSTEENVSPRNDLPYSESIQDRCPQAYF